MSDQSSKLTHDFTRGWETLGHFLQMLRLSAVRHILVSLVLGLAAGTFHFRDTLSDEQGKHLVLYTEASARITAQAWRAEVSFPHGGGRLPNTAPSLTPFRALYGQRTVGFLAKQWGARVAVWSSFFLIVGGMLVSRYGRRAMRDRRLRGGHAVDGRRVVRGPWQRLGWAFSGACVAALAWTLYGFDESQRASLLVYAWAALLETSSALARVAAPGGKVGVAWFGPPLDTGFHRTASVYAWLHVLFGRSVGELCVQWLGRVAAVAVLGGGLAIALPLGQSSLRTRIHAGLSAWQRMAMKHGRYRAFVATLTFMRMRVRAYAARAMRRGTHGESVKKRPPIRLAGVKVELLHEVENFLFMGSPGAGKSTLQKELLDQVRARNERAIVYDASGEYVAEFFRPGRDKIINPLDARSECWSLWADSRDSVDDTAVARSLFPSDSRDPFWSDAAVSIFVAVVKKMRQEGGTSTNRAFYNKLACGKFDELQLLVAGTPAARYFEGESGNMTAGVLATVASKLESWAWLDDPSPPQQPFSIRDFVQNESDSWLFVTSREDQSDALRPLISLWCDIAARAVLSLSENRNRRVWFSLDEVASLQRLTALPKLLSRGRKNGAAVVLGLQSMPQLRRAYGRDDAESMLSMAQTWLVLRCVEPETAQWLEKALGSAEIEEARTSMSLGAQPHREGVSIQRSLRKSPVAMATEIMTLPTLEGYLRQPGQSTIYRVAYTFKDRPGRKQPFFMPREQTRRAAG